ncbi:MAG: 3-isopropylmalate dehydratase [Calditrichaeota bacterium]|nr:MAG: 3-isopropylmalate dehydratase [Calditrichota bacterium]
MNRPLTLTEKIFSHHGIGLKNKFIKPGDVIRTKVDWTLASELAWKGMNTTYEILGRPKLPRPDRFFLAVDHVVDPRVNHEEGRQKLIKLSEDFAKEAGLKHFYGANKTILHTEFYRQLVQPGMVIIGADSHSTSHGGLGSIAIGLGAADVVLAMVTGETWIQVPESIKVEFVGEPGFGVSGKEVILEVLKQLKRNTFALERAVEFTGNIQHLSADARFTVSNMTAELGGLAGIFPADEVTANYISGRPNEYKNEALYFRADEGAEYVETFKIDLSKTKHLVAQYPSPDNVKNVKDIEGQKYNGVFIGACTTTEEELILGALVLEEGMKNGKSANVKGQRIVTPGSVEISENLKNLGLLEIYEKAGFYIGAPGCSMCLGIAADVAGDGETWLSSQNRNFPNRMGKGSYANICSAATVSASSFGMELKDPSELLNKLDRDKYFKMLGRKTNPIEIEITEPNPKVSENEKTEISGVGGLTGKLEGKVQKFGDNIDTDAIIPGQYCHFESNIDLGKHAFKNTKDGFYESVQDGFDIIVAGQGWGSGSSREEAARALKGSGVKIVIAKSFAYIHYRNLANMGIPFVSVKDENFFETVKEGSKVEVNFETGEILVEGKAFKYDKVASTISSILIGDGIVNLYKKFGQDVFSHL